jgi:hypothetical protein
VNPPGKRTARPDFGALEKISVLVVAGDDARSLASAARAAASATAADRRVAIFDLAGAFGPDDPDGLVLAFQDGRSLNALARLLDNESSDRFLVPRGPGPISAAAASHERWPRLVEGFRSTGALLIITVPMGLPGADAFSRIADRTVTVGDAGPTGHEAATRQLPRTPRRWPRLTVAAVAVVVLAGGSWMLLGRHPGTAFAPARGEARADSAPVPALRSASKTAPAPVPMALPQVVNPSDSSRASVWSVELVATNDRTDANFRLAEHGTLPAGTISPVLLGGDAAPWYRVVAGACVDRTAAESLRATLRRTGTLDGNAGLVARLPYALRLDTALTPAVARERVTQYSKRGVAAYALMDDAGHATIYAGAFASPEQTVVLIAELQSAGMAPDLAFRVGRTY